MSSPQQVIAVDPRVAAAGMNPADTRYETEKYCGPITILIGVFCFPCVCCCPCDERQVATDSTGRRVILK